MNEIQDKKSPVSLDLNFSALKTMQDSSESSVYLAATHSDIPINNRLYSEKEMKAAIDSFLKPYAKPVLTHHDHEGEPVGRVTESFYVNGSEWSAFCEEHALNKMDFPQGATGVIVLKADIKDPLFAQKIKDGLYETVSVGFSANSVKCSICGEKSGFFGFACEHIPGNQYDGKTCLGLVEGIEYLEVSFVNIPADKYAGVIKKEAVTEPDPDSAVKQIQENSKEAVLKQGDVISNLTAEELAKDAESEEADLDSSKEEEMEVEMEKDKTPVITDMLLDKCKSFLISDIKDIQKYLTIKDDETNRFDGYSLETLLDIHDEYKRIKAFFVNKAETESDLQNKEIVEKIEPEEKTAEAKDDSEITEEKITTENKTDSIVVEKTEEVKPDVKNIVQETPKIPVIADSKNTIKRDYKKTLLGILK